MTPPHARHLRPRPQASQRGWLLREIHATEFNSTATRWLLLRPFPFGEVAAVGCVPDTKLPHGCWKGSLLFELVGRGEADAPESLARDRKFNSNSGRFTIFRFHDPHDFRPRGLVLGEMRKFNYLLQRRIGFIHLKQSAVSVHHFRFRVFAVTRAIRGFPRHVHWYGHVNSLASSPLRSRGIRHRQSSHPTLKSSSRVLLKHE